MPIYGKVIVIRRNGSDGSQFPMTNETCIFGRSHDCDIRVQLPYVSNEQCKIVLNEEGKFILHNVSQSNHTVVNDKVVQESITLTNKDIITIIDRSFRFEYPENHSVKDSLNSALKTPLSEQQTTAEIDSPFGKLVKDMKSMIKSKTPIKRRSAAKDQELRSNISKDEKKNGTPKTTPRRSSLAIKEKENVESEKGKRRSRGRRSSENNLKEMRKSVNDVEKPAETSFNTVIESNTDSTENTVRNNNEVIASTEVTAADEKSRGKRRSPRRKSSFEVPTDSSQSSFVLANGSASQNSSSLASNSPNSSVSNDMLNEGMITETSLDTSGNGSTKSDVGESTIKTTSSTRNSIEKKRRSRDSKSPTLSRVSRDGTPNISLTSANSTLPAEDPYSFPEENDEKMKKYKRRSSGSSTLSRKQTLLLFGSPRNKEVTPLRRSIGRLRKTSEPLLEEAAEVTSPSLQSNKKVWDPLPEVVEVENNSSPIKASRRSLKHTINFNQLDTPPMSTRRKLSRVSFGPDLSPEQFLKELPPNTPIRKGATPSKTSSRKSVSLPTVKETNENTFKSPLAASKKYQKVVRTPTPFKPNVKNFQSKSLLQQVLHATVANEIRPSDDASPKLTRKRKSSDSLENDRKHKELVKDESSVPAKSPSAEKSKRKSKGNTPIKNIHKTATNLRRRSLGKLGKPTWSEIVKKPVKSTTASNKAAAKTAISKVSKQKKAVKKGETPPAKARHVDSPATIYIGRSRKRIQPTKTPRPSKAIAAVKLDIPANESFSGLTDLFATPTASENSENILYDDLKTPMSVGEMIVSPMINESSSDASQALGASPLLRKTPNVVTLRKDSSEGVVAKRRRLSPRLSASIDGFGKGDFGTRKLLKTPKQSDDNQVQEKFGTKRLLKTPKEPKGKEVENNFGTKRLLKTPREPKEKPVESKFGTKRLLKTPKDKKSSPVENKFGTKRIFKTPREEKSKPVEKHLGTTKLFKTPRGSKNAPVEDHFGTKRIFQTPRDEKSAPVDDHTGIKRLYQTPRPEKSQPIQEHFGTKRVFTSPKEKVSSQPVRSNFGLRRIFRTYGKQPKNVSSDFDDAFHLSILNSPDDAGEEKYEEKSSTSSQNFTRPTVKTENKPRSTRRKKEVVGEIKQHVESNETSSSLENLKISPKARPNKAAPKPIRKSRSKINSSGSDASSANHEESSEVVKSKKQVTFNKSVKFNSGKEALLVEAEEPVAKKRKQTTQSAKKKEPSKAASKKSTRRQVKKEESDTTSTVSTTKSTRRGRKAVEAVEDNNHAEPQLKAKPGRKRKMEDTGSEEAHAEKIVEQDSKPTRSTRGRGKSTSTVESERDGKVPAPKTTSRRGRAKTVRADEVASVDETASLVETVVPTKTTRTTRKKSKIDSSVSSEDKVADVAPKKGRSKTSSKKENSIKGDETSSVETVVPVNKGRRTRKQPEQDVSLEAEKVNAELIQDSVPTKPAPRKGRSRTVSSNKVEDAAVVPVTKTTRRGRKPKTIEDVKPEGKPNARKIRKVEETETDESVVPVTKTTRRGRKPKTIEDVKPEGKPSARKIRKVEETETDQSEVTPTEQTKTNRRGRKKAQVKEDKKTDEEIAPVPTKPTPRKGRSRASTKSKKGDEQEGNVSEVVGDVEKPKSKSSTVKKSSSNVNTAASKRGAKLSKTSKESEQPADKNTSTPKKGRSRNASKITDDDQSEISIETKPRVSRKKTTSKQDQNTSETTSDDKTSTGAGGSRRRGKASRTSSKTAASELVKDAQSESTVRRSSRRK